MYTNKKYNKTCKYYVYKELELAWRKISKNSLIPVSSNVCPLFFFKSDFRTYCKCTLFRAAFKFANSAFWQIAKLNKSLAKTDNPNTLIKKIVFIRAIKYSLKWRALGDSQTKVSVKLNTFSVSAGIDRCEEIVML